MIETHDANHFKYDKYFQSHNTFVIFFAVKRELY